MICGFILYPNYHNRVLHQKNEVKEDLDLEDSSEINNSYDKFYDSTPQNVMERNDPTPQNVMERNAHADKIRKMEQKFE